MVRTASLPRHHKLNHDLHQAVAHWRCICQQNEDPCEANDELHGQQPRERGALRIRDALTGVQRLTASKGAGAAEEARAVSDAVVAPWMNITSAVRGAHAVNSISLGDELARTQKTGTPWGIPVEHVAPNGHTLHSLWLGTAALPTPGTRSSFQAGRQHSRPGGHDGEIAGDIPWSFRLGRSTRWRHQLPVLAI
jgi:hypothetical protein